MKIAFLISAHTDPQHLLRLTEQLPEDSETFVHVDLKSNLQEFRTTVTSPRVHFIEERYDVMWASMQQVKFQRALVKEALSFGQHFDYLFTLSDRNSFRASRWNTNRALTPSNIRNTVF